jgi:ATP-dependent DNA ligase
MECLEVDQIPGGEPWRYELKLDGYRTIATKQDGEVRLFPRTEFRARARTRRMASDPLYAHARARESGPEQRLVARS